MKQKQTLTQGLSEEELESIRKRYFECMKNIRESKKYTRKDLDFLFED